MAGFVNFNSRHYRPSRPSPSQSMTSGVYCVSDPPSRTIPEHVFRSPRVPPKAANGSAVPGKYIGIADLPNQIYRRVLNEGFKLNLMILGEPGVGKATLINSLFGFDVYGGKEDDKSPFKRHSNPVAVNRQVMQLEVKGMNILVNMLDVPDFGGLVDNSRACEVVEQYIDEQFHEYFECSHRKRSQAVRIDKRVHCCLYVIPPTGHSVRPLDITTMKNLGARTNVIPIIGRADSLTMEERMGFQDTIRKQLKENEVQVYCFPWDEEVLEGTEKKTEEDMAKLIPFAVVGSNTVVQTRDGSKMRVRKYPWGTVDVEDPKFSDLALLRRLLLFVHLSDIVEITDGLHYSNHIREFLDRNGPPNSRYIDRACLSTMDPDSRNSGNASFFSSLESGKTESDACISKLEQELQQIFDQKVKEKVRRLDESEKELKIKYAEWDEQLANKRKKLAQEHEIFNNQKLVLIQAYPQLQERLAQEMNRAGIRA